MRKGKNYVNWQDRELTITGKLLLIEGLKLYEVDAQRLEQLQYTTYGRPYLDLELDFNISHSGEYVICGLAKGMRLGVDIEERKTVDINSFYKVFTPKELIAIRSSKKTEETFYNYWTIKESVMKAIGKGLSIPPVEIEIDSDQQASYDDQIWYVRNIQIDEHYASHIATDYKYVKLNYHWIDFHRT
ncbi:MAG: 4'-phosphopantetheinyl transferase superfamily protein [Bacteroidota bacterium]